MCDQEPITMGYWGPFLESPGNFSGSEPQLLLLKLLEDNSTSGDHFKFDQPTQRQFPKSYVDNPVNFLYKSNPLVGG